MSQVQQDLVFSNLLTLNFTYIEQRLRKNFQIIASRMSRLQGLLTLDDRVRTLQKQAKFASMKLDSIVLRLPQNSSNNLSQDDVKNICNERITEYMSSDNIKTTKAFTELRSFLEKGGGKQQQKEPKRNVVEQEQAAAKKEVGATGRTEETGGTNTKVVRDVLKKHLNQEEMAVVDRLMKEDKTTEQLALETAAKLASLERQFEQSRLSKGVLPLYQKDFERFNRYEDLQKKFNTKQDQKIKGNGKQSKEPQRDILWKQSQDPNARQSATAKDTELRTTLRDGQAIFTPNQTLKDSRRLAVSRRAGGINDETILMKVEDQQPVDPEKERISKRNKSLSKLVMPQKAQKRLRVEDVKDIGPIIREIQQRLENKVSKEVFTNLMQDLEDRLEALRHSRQSNDAYQLKRYYNSVENRLQAVISFIQQAQEDEDPLIAKKKWTCMSCDKQADKYAAKVGPHLNWETLNTKRLSPTKAGAFGQTVLFANKVKNIIDQRKGADIPEGQ